MIYQLADDFNVNNIKSTYSTVLKKLNKIGSATYGFLTKF